MFEDFLMIWPAIIVGVFVILTHVPLGQVVLKRNLIFMDLAVAQVASIGALAAYVFFPHDAFVIPQLFAFMAAIGSALLLKLIEKVAGRYKEALIGVIYVLAANLGVLLVASDPHGGDIVHFLLAGNLLWAVWEQAIPLILWAVVVMVLLFRANFELKGLWFYLIFAVSITASVQIIGVYMVFATLIIPALFAIFANSKTPLRAGYIIAFSGYLGGLILSYVSDWPAGALIIWLMFTIGLFWVIFTHITIEQE